MKDAPKEFQRQLAREFDGRLRIRWSDARGEWHIEQKVGRAILPPLRIDPYDDSLIAARDGYTYVMTVRDGDRMPCPKCNFEIKVPVMHSGEAICEMCKFRGLSGTYPAAYFPLGDALITHLKRIDPHKRSKDMMRLMDARNDALLVAKQRAAMNEIEATTKENWTQMMAIPSVGYTGKEKAWAHA